ncbi:MAG TPA: SPW repeat protein [Candidatus Dormibacteraeota bacterium]|nr:SPW repeat protein [Candidatus Dormibacteraeota bacterium]
MIASRRWQDWTTTLIGALVALSPLVFTTAWTENEALTGYIFGGLIFVVGVAKLLFEEAGYLELAQFALAVALFLAPWVIGFTAVTGIAWAAWIGAVALVLVLATLVFTDQPAAARTA